ncbi:hypothetical protein Vadar_012412 [Vaccinium darrowii]|uniref:Uncharacterized protein n=1 Tax=Vaccinium darrowii TaxID=229202 RepID=A0ACB7ZBC2_9ERIC|nr:hypothetical protein Vadar_012412 [Vaccinium darrowii]
MNLLSEFPLLSSTTGANKPSSSLGSISPLFSAVVENSGVSAVPSSNMCIQSPIGGSEFVMPVTLAHSSKGLVSDLGISCEPPVPPTWRDKMFGHRDCSVVDNVEPKPATKVSSPVSVVSALVGSGVCLPNSTTLGSGNRFVVLDSAAEVGDVVTVSTLSPNKVCVQEGVLPGLGGSDVLADIGPAPEDHQAYSMQSTIGKLECSIFAAPSDGSNLLDLQLITDEMVLSGDKVRKWIYDNNLSFVGLVETKVRSNNVEATMKLCLPLHWKFVHNIGSGVVARIIVAWNTSNVVVSLVLMTDQCITCKVALVQSQDWFYISVVYGFNKPVERRLLWNDLRTLYGLLGSDAWLLLGDFNSIRTLFDRVGSVSFDGVAAHEFNSCLADIGMEDMASKGFLFTWTNRRGGLGFVKSRIDRALINSRWQVQYPESEAIFQVPGMFDHCPIVVTILRQQSRRIPFKFFNFWMSHDKFSSLLDNAWAGVVHGNPMVALSHKLRNLKFLLKDFNKEFYSDIQ